MNTRATLVAIALTTLAAGAQADPKHRRHVCDDCGRVTGVRVTEQDGKGGATGVILGGVAGGLLGNQVGKGTGRDLATVAGAVGGAYAGKHIEGKMKTVKTWVVTVRYENGRTGTFHFRDDPHFRNGERVHREGGTIVRG